MNLQYRVDLLVRLGEYMCSENEAWIQTKEKAAAENGWFIPEFTDLACSTIARNFLQREKLENWVRNYPSIPGGLSTRKIGIVMAGNIPLVGFHDFLSVFISGHAAVMKPSARDEVLIRHLSGKLCSWAPELNNHISFAPMLKGCDAFIATGSNNTSRYFEFYFSKYPHIIRRNRSSLAVLTGSETRDELEKLSDDVHQYFGMGCRNVTKLYVPKGYDFIPLLDAFSRYKYFQDHHKYKNNYDYNLAVYILNNQFYMTCGSVLLIENPNLFSPISQLNYEYYSQLPVRSEPEDLVQCVVGKNYLPFGSAQSPGLSDYADRTDTVEFLLNL